MTATTAVTAVLWDIDGTLLTSGRVAVTAFLDAVADVTGRRPDGRGLDLGGRIDPDIASELLRAVEADAELVPQVLHRHHTLMQERAGELQGQVRPLAGVLRTLQILHDAGVRQTVVTGNIESVGLLKLQAAQLVPPIRPEVGGFGDHGVDRVAVARSSIARLIADGWPGDLDSCWIVGDTPRDLSCARELGVRCALVATGRHSVESMAELGADILLSGLEDVDELLLLWGLSGPTEGVPA